ncbi:MAG: ribonuclease HII [Saprospiraceae bacterium]|nr:ribonuclease HII [Saprospiraceae bacterium]
MLLTHHQTTLIEAGCDEAGRGCLAGPVFAAAVILPPGFYHPDLNDSKQITESQRDKLRDIIEREATAWAVASLSTSEIETHNILWASVLAMHKALDALTLRPEFILVDGNRFRPYAATTHLCVVKGDGKYASIAAASILAKTHRDEYMTRLDAMYPHYNWSINKGYPTATHRNAIREYGPCEHHRKTFQLLPRGEQLELF